MIRQTATPFVYVLLFIIGQHHHRNLKRRMLCVDKSESAVAYFEIPVKILEKAELPNTQEHPPYGCCAGCMDRAPSVVL